MADDRYFDMTLTVPSGTVAIGGYSPTPEELSVVHARGPDGRPIIPSTALRGALREALEAIVRRADGWACRGGDGVDPRMLPESDATEPSASTASRPCTLLDGGPCLPCLLFGSQHDLMSSAGAHAMPFGALVLGDGMLDETAAPPEWMVTHGVAIDRRRRSAKDGLLFNRAAPQPGSALVFRAEGRLVVERDVYRRALAAAAHLTRHIGSNTSRGLGRVDIALDWKASAAPAVEPRERDLGLVVELTRPACIGVPIRDENANRTRHDIPGSNLRGAVGWAIAEALKAADVDPDADDDFQRLVAERTDEGGGAIFDFLYPCDGEAPDGIAGPWPLTRRVCKRHASEHRATDVLLDRLILSGTTPERIDRVVDGLAAGSGCPDCGGPQKTAEGWRGRTERVDTRLITRVSLDGRRRSARQGMLFTHEVIETGTRFVGSIRHVPAGTAARLAEGLSAPLSFGRGRAMGWGRIALQATPLPGLASLEARQRVFGGALRKRSTALGAMLGTPVEHMVVLTLRSPLLLNETGEAPDVAALGEALGGATSLLQVRRFGVESGWDQRKGARARRRSVLAGAVYVFDLGRPWTEARETLVKVEADGVGLGRCRGFGRVVCFDPALTP